MLRFHEVASSLCFSHFCSPCHRLVFLYSPVPSTLLSPLTLHPPPHYRFPSRDRVRIVWIMVCASRPSELLINDSSPMQVPEPPISTEDPPLLSESKSSHAQRPIEMISLRFSDLHNTRAIVLLTSLTTRIIAAYRSWIEREMRFVCVMRQ